MDVGFIGVGSLGGALAQQALDAGHQVTVFDPAPDCAERLVQLGARQAESPAEVASAADVVAFAVFDEAQLRAALLGPSGARSGARPGHVFVVHSTVDWAAVVELASELAGDGIELLDVGAIGGRLSMRGLGPVFTVGGSEAGLARARPLLESYGGKIVHVGATGMGMKAKIARNVVTFWQFLGFQQGFTTATAAGIDIDTFREVVIESTDAMTRGFLGLDDPGAPYSDPRRAAIVSKDLTAALALAELTGANLDPTAWLRDRPELI